MYVYVSESIIEVYILHLTYYNEVQNVLIQVDLLKYNTDILLQKMLSFPAVFIIKTVAKLEVTLRKQVFFSIILSKEPSLWFSTSSPGSEAPVTLPIPPALTYFEFTSQ